MNSSVLSKSRFEELCTLHPYYSQHKDDGNNWLSISVQEAWKMFQRLPHASHSRRLLDVGSGFGIFAPAYQSLWGYDDIRLIDFGNTTGVIERNATDGTHYRFPSIQINIEKDKFPFEDEYFETIVWKETIEHLLFDPMFTFSEINRVLMLGGTLLFSVPNVVSNSSLLRLINCQSPVHHPQYIIGDFSDPMQVPFLLAHGHNHEYTQKEVELLARLSGFEIKELFGVMPRPQNLKGWKFQLYEMLTKMIFPRSPRIIEDKIVALMKKTKSIPLSDISDRYPKLLYCNK